MGTRPLPRDPLSARLALLLLALLAAAPAASAAPRVESGETARIYGPTTGDADHIPNLQDLSPLTAAGGHVAALLSAETTTNTEPELFGRVLDARGRPQADPVLWSRPGVDIFNAGAAVGRSGEAGLAVWHDDSQSHSSYGGLLVRPFDAATAQPTADPVAISDRTSFLYDVEAYRGGYAAMYERYDGQVRRTQALLLLGADGQPQGEPIVVTERKFNGFSSGLYGSPSRERMALVSQTGSNQLEFRLFGPAGETAKRRVGTGRQDDYLVDVSHAAGGGWMTLWAREFYDEETLDYTYRFILRRLTAAARLGPATFITKPFKRFPAAQLAFNDREGVVVLGDGRRCAFTALPVSLRGRPLAAASELGVDCGAGRVGLAYVELTPSRARRFLLGFTTFARGAEHFVRTVGLRIRGR